ncbi:MAG TPA: 6-phosphogluconolactonase [Chloroflexota bacterium]|nr:6-phosphogluconolactonase [Chloroflexota bacterium]
MSANRSSADIRVFPSSDALSDAAAAFFAETAAQAVDSHGVFRVALSGGSTPKGMYELLASSDFEATVPWERTQVFFSDERFVPPDSSESNYHLAESTLLSHVPVRDRFVHRVATEGLPPEEAASLYEQGIRRVFESADDEIPRFDLILLGLGPDGHTASLFPGTSALGVTNQLVVANFVPKLDAWRVTFTYPLINAGRAVAFLVQGPDKAEPLRGVREGDESLPASGVQLADGRLIRFVDEAAAGSRGIGIQEDAAGNP